jgi:hypothetical protein
LIGLLVSPLNTGFVSILFSSKPFFDLKKIRNMSGAGQGCEGSDSGWLVTSSVVLN